ncbi:zinc-dependent alcohol dehydrogenase family protein [Lacisediminihabitans profunda]|uniref:alcohol dehydrogenase n=1 Tax=Lacisediminihabitans profunda TaxID=2594790 RepID=A0A5C8UJD8_9MICO|nr:zinc-dependent alcohol dehydrogenase family protein [Lacisediminihabitans profunda]TXN28309.1 zinc-dependent alcohol dehydrogenase family protein [Lacisediminihabitans profunda]
MKAWTSDSTTRSIRLAEREPPLPAPGEVLVRVTACGVCRTDLHVVDGDLPVHRVGVVPGHQVVGTVAGLGDGVIELRLGDLVGIAWLRGTCGACEWCRTGRENLCPRSTYTGWDADGGFAEFATVPEAFAYLLPGDSDPIATAPLLCAGIIGFRALARAQVPPGGRLGIYGFGSSAHITAQLAMAAGAEVYAMTRGAANRELASSLGVAFVGDAEAVPPHPLDAAIVFAPAGELVPLALRATAAGGTVVVAGIHLTNIPTLEYESTLFHERDLRSVTANTRGDGAAFLRLAHTLRLRPRTTLYPFERAAEALDDLRSGSASGSLVLEL